MKDSSYLSSYCFVVRTLLLATVLLQSCKQSIPKPVSSIKWSYRIDSILHDKRQINTDVDFLRNKVRNATSDTEAINAMNALSEDIWGGDFKILQEVVDKSREIHYEYGEVVALVHMAFKNWGNSEVQDSLYKLALQKAENLGDKKLQLIVWGRMGGSAKYYNDKTLPLKYSLKCLEIAQTTDDKSLLGGAYFAVGSEYEAIDNYPLALEYFLKSLELLKESNDRTTQMWLYDQLSYTYKHQKDYSHALEYMNKCLEIQIEKKDSLLMCQSYEQLSDIYLSLKDYDSALQFHRKAQNMASITIGYNDYMNIKDSADLLGRQEKYSQAIEVYIKADSLSAHIYGDSTPDHWIDIANLYERMNNFDMAIIYLEALDSMIQSKVGTQEVPYKSSTGLEISYKLANAYFMEKRYKKAMMNGERAYSLACLYDDKEDLSRTSKILSEIYDSLRMVSKAYKMYKLYIQTNDSIDNIEKVKRFSNLTYLDNEKQMKAERQRDNALAFAEVQRQKIYRNISMAGIALVIIFAGIIYGAFRQKQKHNLVITTEKNKSDLLLKNILPEAVAEELKQNGSAKAKLFDNVTVLYTDFKSFTTVSEKLTPEELVEELNTCFKAFDEIITRYGIEKIKTVGDAYIAVSGLPVADVDHAAKVIEAAIEIRDFMKSRQEELLNSKLETFEIRIGVHSGSVVAGIVGIKKFAYDIWGDTVNTAARMEQNGEPGKINISYATYELIKRKFNCEYRGEIDAKNKGKLKMYFVS